MVLNLFTIRNETNADNHISQFKLTTPYDVSTLSLEGNFDVSSVSAASREVAFSNDCLLYTSDAADDQ